VHLKDVDKRGSHHTVPLGTGCVGIDAVIQQMKSMGYGGMWSWEDEPEGRNPFDVAVEMRKYIAARV
jgi:sugar phosphate isomerase/epimerase